MIIQKRKGVNGTADAEDDNIADYWGGRMLKN
jgi:hypothetical protein